MVLHGTPLEMRIRIRERERTARLARWSADALEILQRASYTSFDLYQSHCLRRWSREVMRGESNVADAQLVIASTWIHYNVSVSTPATPAGFVDGSGLPPTEQVLRSRPFMTWGFVIGVILLVAGHWLGRAQAIREVRAREAVLQTGNTERAQRVCSPWLGGAR